jgi:ATP-binding cassette, subfamily B, bacterial
MSDLDIEESFARARLDRRTFHRVLALLRPVLGRLWWVLLVEIILVSSIFARPWHIRMVIDYGIIAEGDAWIVDYVLIGLMAGGLALTWILRFGLAGVAQWLLGTIALRVLADLRKTLFEHVQSLSVRYFDRTRVGRIVARVDRDVDAIEPLVVHGASELLSTLLRCIGAGALIWWMSPPLFWGLSGIVPVLLLSMWAFKRYGTHLWAAAAEAKSRVTAHLVESVAGVRVIQQTTGEDRNLQHYVGLLHKLDAASIRGTYGWAWFQPFAAFLFTVGIGILLLIGGQELAAGHLTMGQMAQAVFYIFVFLGPLQELGELFERFATATASAQRIFLLLDTKPEITDPAQPQTLAVTDGRKQGAIIFDQVTFGYLKDKTVLHDVYLNILPGETIAIVGPTGHGKSTLVQLLARFYDVQQGRILVDGVDVRAVTQHELRRHMAVVLQDNVLFSGSILDNLRLAKPSASDEELMAAATTLGADHIFTRLPNGWHTQVGPMGGHLSHGQRQLVCIVRAFVADPRILVLDEATSAVDLHTENRLQHALRHVAQNRTAIIIAHRLSTIRDADRIAVIEHGKIVEIGSHDVLMKNNGVYATLYAAYERGENPDNWQTVRK